MSVGFGGKPVFLKMITGLKMTYKFFGPKNLLIMGGAGGLGSYFYVDQLLQNGSPAIRGRALIESADKNDDEALYVPTALESVAKKFDDKSAVVPSTAVVNGLIGGLTRPYSVTKRLLMNVTQQPVEKSDLLLAVYEQNLTPLIVDGCKAMVNQEMISQVADAAAREVADHIKQELYDVPRRIFSGQIPILDVYSRFQQVRNSYDEAQRQIATAGEDGIKVYNATIRYYTTIKLFEIMGAAGAGGATAWMYNRYLANPAQRMLSPVTVPLVRYGTAVPRMGLYGASMVPGLGGLRRFATKEMAFELGTAVARRSPLAILMLVAGVGFYYKTQHDFELFINDMARSYPDASRVFANKLRNNQ